MSDHAPDPMDKAYAQAEAVLDDEAARAARRTRVLGAVAREAQAPRAESTPSQRRLSWGRGGWLAAASVAGLSALVAFRLYLPAEMRQERPPAAAAPAAAIGTTPAPVPAAPAVASRAETGSPRDVPAAVTPPPPSPPIQTGPAAAPAAPPASEGVSDVVVTARRVESRVAAERAPAPAIDTAVPASPGDRGARLRAAAAVGRIAELSTLLTPGAPIDASDDDGETALMKAVQAKHPAAAALLLHHGANLDLENHAGASARDMAASIGDPELDRALGLAP